MKNWILKDEKSGKILKIAELDKKTIDILNIAYKMNFSSLKWIEKTK